MNAEVRNNPTEYRYEVWADGELAGYTQYGFGRGWIAFVHTKILAISWPLRCSQETDYEPEASPR